MMSSAPLKIVFAGTPEFAAAHLQALIESKHQLLAVYTQPDRPSGRGQKLTASPVKLLAEANDIEVLQPQTLKAEQQHQILSEYEADLLIVVAYGLMLPDEILNAPRLGCINVHASLLPRWRGAAPIQRAIEAGDIQTGVTIMQMDSGLDTGDMLFTSRINIDDRETSESLFKRLMEIGPLALITALEKLSTEGLTAISQDDTQANYAKKISKSDAAINWQSTAQDIDRKIRAFTPWPGAYIEHNGDKIKVVASISQRTDIKTSQIGTIINADKDGLLVACQQGAILITSLQIPGKKMMPVALQLNNYKDRFKVGTQFSS